jgi:hypothetical protein
LVHVPPFDKGRGEGGGVKLARAGGLALALAKQKKLQLLRKKLAMLSIRE